MILDLRKFIERERPIWDELDKLLRKMENDPAAKLTLADAERAHYLYERTSSALVRIATFAAEPSLITFLQALVARAYSELNDNRARSRRFHPRTWFFTTFPRTFRQYQRYFWFALLLTVAGALFGGSAITFDTRAKPLLLGEFPHLIGNPEDRVHEEEHSTSSRLEGEHTTFSAYLMTHNARVALASLALGMTWAIGTIILVFYNGVILGAVVVDYVRAGQSVFLAGWLLPHGVIEIPAILIASQAGLLLGQALIGWGSDQTVGQRLRQISNPLVTLICGACLLLIWAGIIESFLSQYHAPVLPYSLKISFGVFELALLVFYLGFFGRKSSDGAVSSSYSSSSSSSIV
jgi:uncharacterized membrane protein SpoIIM required for sporulation